MSSSTPPETKRYVIGSSWCGYSKKQWNDVPEDAHTVHVKCDTASEAEKSEHPAAYAMCEKAKGFPLSVIGSTNNVSQDPCAMGYVGADTFNQQCPRG